RLTRRPRRFFAKLMTMVTAVPSWLQPHLIQERLATADSPAALLNNRMSISKISSSKRSFAAIAAGILVFVLSSGYVIHRRTDQSGIASAALLTQPKPGYLKECISDTQRSLGNDHVSMVEYQQIWQLCGTQMWGFYSLSDYDIRRGKFIQQQSD